MLDMIVSFSNARMDVRSRMTCLFDLRLYGRNPTCSAYRGLDDLPGGSGLYLGA